MVRAIPHRHLQQLVEAAASLPGPKLDVALWRRLADRSGTFPAAPGAESDDSSAEIRGEVVRLRAQVAACLDRLAQRADEVLGPALASARQAWERVDDLVIVDSRTVAALTECRHALEAAQTRAGAMGAVAVEGLLALEAARGLIALAERRLSALIRLRGTFVEAELLPGGRPFLDLGQALAEAARTWV